MWKIRGCENGEGIFLYEIKLNLRVLHCILLFLCNQFITRTQRKRLLVYPRYLAMATWNTSKWKNFFSLYRIFIYRQGRRWKKLMGVSGLELPSKKFELSCHKLQLFNLFKCYKANAFQTKVIDREELFTCEGINFLERHYGV